MLLKYTMENEVLSTACVTLGRDHPVPCACPTASPGLAPLHNSSVQCAVLLQLLKASVFIHGAP